MVMATKKTKVVTSRLKTDEGVIESCELLKNAARDRELILFFTGNGMSEGQLVRGYTLFRQPHRKKPTLSTKNLSTSFIKKSSDSNPREFKICKDSISNLKDAFDTKNVDYQMVEFMRDLSKVGQIRQDFIEHVIGTCCESSPTLNHFQLLILYSVLRASTSNKPDVIELTTNYDNLMERAHLSRELSSLVSSTIFDLLGMNLKKISTELIRLEDRMTEKLKSFVPTPYYTFDVPQKNINKEGLPIVPIHGSIRICRCVECGKSLQTEAAAIGDKKCVYCGADIPSVVVPMGEGETDKTLLGLLERLITEAELIVFVGYSFDDPHIMDRIRYALQISKKKIRIINCCHRQINPEDIGLDPDRITELNEDIDQSLNAIIKGLSDTVKNDAKGLMNMSGRLIGRRAF